MKKSQQITILSIVALIAVGSYLYLHRNKTTTPQNVATEATSEAVEIKEESSAYSIAIAYPAFTEALPGAKEANQIIKNDLDLRIAQFKKDANETFDAPTSLPPEIKSTAQGSGSIEYETDRYVSLYFGAEWYMRGAAHGMHTTNTYIFDKKLQKLVDITDLFASGSGYLPFLSKYSYDDLLAQSKLSGTGFLYDEQMLRAGTEGTFDNFHLVLPTRDGLMIYFTEYQVAPYAAGPQQVVVPYEKLKPYINPEGVLAEYLK